MAGSTSAAGVPLDEVVDEGGETGAGRGTRQRSLASRVRILLRFAEQDSIGIERPGRVRGRGTGSAFTSRCLSRRPERHDGPAAQALRARALRRRGTRGP